MPYKCKQEQKRKTQQWFKDNPEKSRSYSRKSYLNNKSKRRFRKIFLKYGLTQEQWTSILEEQDKACAICRRKLKIGGKTTGLTAHTDHCHDTGEVRGILCMYCNYSVVKFFDKNLDRIDNLKHYLTKEYNYGKVPGYE